MDSLWEATRGSTLGKSTANQAKRSVLLTRTGVMMARSLEGRFLQRVRDEHPGLLWGLDFRLIGRCQSQVVAQCG